MNKEVFDIGIVGLGINGLMHMNGLASLPGVRVAAICDTDAGRRQNALSMLRDDSVTVSHDYRKICEMPEIDAIAVCTPTYTHSKIARFALENGKDILLEKPIAPKISDVDNLIQGAFKTDRIVQVGLVYRYSNLYRTAAKMVENGDFGTVTMAYCNEFRDNFPTQWFFEKSKSGGALLDKNCHHFDLFNWFIGSRPEKVYAAGGQHVVKGKRIKVNCGYAPDGDLIIKNPDIVDHASVVIQYANKAIANLNLVMYEKEPLDGLEVGFMGTNGGHAVAKRDSAFTAGGGPLGEFHEIPVDYLSDNQTIGHIGAFIQHVEFIERMKDRALPFANLLNARESMVVAMAAELSIKEKREVDIDEFRNPAVEHLIYIYKKELSTPTLNPLPPPAIEITTAPLKRNLIKKLLSARHKTSEVSPFSKDIFAKAIAHLNDDDDYRSRSVNLNAVVKFKYAVDTQVLMDITAGEARILPDGHEVKEDAAVTFTEKGWTDLQKGKNPYILALTGQVRISGNFGIFSPYANDFMKMAQVLRM